MLSEYSFSLHPPNLSKALGGGEGSSSARQALSRTISAAGCVFSPGKEVPVDVVGGWEGAPEAMEKARGCWVGKFVHMGLSLQPSASRA